MCSFYFQNIKLWLILAAFLNSAIYAEETWPILSEPIEETPKPVRVLSLDGGGIRGIIEAVILTQMEEELQKPLSEVFDMIVGTSTGGILALGLAAPGPDGVTPLYSARDLLEIYSERGAEVFSASLFHRIVTLGGLLGPRYDADSLENLLLDYFDDLKLSEALTEVMVTGYHVEGQSGVEFSSKEARNFPLEKDCYMREIARATSAAPVFFDSAHVQFYWGTLYNVVDGGLIANNPALSGYADAVEAFPGREIEVYSIGSGEITAEELGAELRGRGLINWLEPILRHFQIGSASTDSDVLHKILNRNGKENFFRLNVWLEDGHKAMDDHSENNLTYLLRKGEEAVATPKFREMIRRLKNPHP